MCTKPLNMTSWQYMYILTRTLFRFSGLNCIKLYVLAIGISINNGNIMCFVITSIIIKNIYPKLFSVK